MRKRKTMTRQPTKGVPVAHPKRKIRTFAPGESSASASDVMTVNEVAALIRVHRVTVHKMVMRGELPAFRIGVFWRIRRDHVDQLLARGDRQDPGK